MNRLRIILFFLPLWLLVACAEAEPTPALPAATTAPTLSPTPTRAPVTPTPEPSPTPIVPSVAALDQELAENGRLVISRIVATEPGWLVIHATAADGAVGEVLGTTPIAAGVSTDVIVDIDPLAASPTLVAMLHRDGGAADTFEFPGTDEPVLVGDSPVADPFVVTLAFTLPAVTVSDQNVTEAGDFLIDSAYMPNGGWVVVHADVDGAIGAVLGVAYLEPGLSENVPVSIPWREGTPTLYAVLYEDNGRSRRLDVPGEDLPLLLNGQPVVAEFAVTYPPDVYVLDQPIIDSTFVVERALVSQPSFLVVYQDENGEVGPIIGSQAIPAGLSEQVTVEVLRSAVTNVLYIFIHEDTVPGGGFDFPVNDPPLIYEGRLPEPFVFRTNPGNYVVSRDQALTTLDSGETAVTVPLAVVDVPGWVAIRADDNGQPGAVIGQSPLVPGVNRNITVAINDEAATAVLYAVLHLDAGTASEFEFPGVDVALQRNRAPIAAPFALEP